MRHTPMHFEQAMQTSRMQLAASASMGTRLVAKGPKFSRASSRRSALESRARHRSYTFGWSLWDSTTTASAKSAGEAGCSGIRPDKHDHKQPGMSISGECHLNHTLGVR